MRAKKIPFLYFLLFFFLWPSIRPPAVVIIFCSSPLLARVLTCSVEPTTVPPTRRIGSSGKEVKRASIGVKILASSRVSTSIIVGSGLRLKSARMAFTSREADEKCWEKFKSIQMLQGPRVNIPWHKGTPDSVTRHPQPLPSLLQAPWDLSYQNQGPTEDQWGAWDRQSGV